MRVLVCEDDARIGRAVRDALLEDGYVATLTTDGEDAFNRLKSEPYDLLVLDWMLPKRNGLEVLVALRERGADFPVLMLTARDRLEHRTHGLDAGADDYLVKPFAMPELLARVRSLLRRATSQQNTTIHIDDLTVDRLSRTVTRAGIAIDLTVREYELLEYLCLHRNRVVSREMLAHDVWRAAGRATPLDNVIDVHVARLRRKLDQSRPLIHTIRGVGFVLKESA